MGKVELKIDEPYPKQQEFFKATTRRVAYGGARGGGKSWAARNKAILLCVNYVGIQILFLRRSLQELRENHILPLQKQLKGVARFKQSTKEFIFPNGSRIVLGYCDSETDVLQYQGQAYDVIFLEEATQFTEFQYSTLTESNRRSTEIEGKFTPRMYITCNPGGVGHQWVKRLFVDKIYQSNENPSDYTFIPSRVYDNAYLMENDPDYVKNLEALPEARRRAMLDGDWNVFEGQYFPEFRVEQHVCNPFEIPSHWDVYRTMDYGLDMCAVYWIAVDESGNAYVYRELYEEGLIISRAAERINELEVHDMRGNSSRSDYNNDGIGAQKPRDMTGVHYKRVKNGGISPPETGETCDKAGDSMKEGYESEAGGEPLSEGDVPSGQAAVDTAGSEGSSTHGSNTGDVGGPFSEYGTQKGILASPRAPMGKQPLLTFAPPDLWSRRQDTGKSGSQIFMENGIFLTRSKNDRIAGWSSVREWLRVVRATDTHTGEESMEPRLKIFSTCRNLIRTLPQLQFDEKKVNDAATEPHEVTHGPDALRYFCTMMIPPTVVEKSGPRASRINFREFLEEPEDEEMDEYIGFMVGNGY